MGGRLFPDIRVWIGRKGEGKMHDGQEEERPAKLLIRLS